MEQNHSHAEILTTPPAITTPAVTNITATSVTLHAGTIGMLLVLGSGLPYNHLFLSVNLFIISTSFCSAANLRPSLWLCYNGLNSQLLLNTLVQLYNIPTLLTKVSQRRLKQDAYWDLLITRHCQTFGAQTWVSYPNMMEAGKSFIICQLLTQVLMILLILMITPSLIVQLTMHTLLLMN